MIFVVDGPSWNSSRRRARPNRAEEKTPSKTGVSKCLCLESETSRLLELFVFAQQRVFEFFAHDDAVENGSVFPPALYSNPTSAGA